MTSQVSPRFVLAAIAVFAAALLVGFVAFRHGSSESAEPESRAPAPSSEASPKTQVGKVVGSAVGRANDSAARTNIRLALPAINAYFAENGSYDGLSVQALRESVAPGLDNVAVTGSGSSYCVESAIGGASAHQASPTAEILRGPCPPGAR